MMSSLSEYLVADASGAVPVVPVDTATLPQWLEGHPEQRDWLKLTGFKAEPGSFVFLPAMNGKPVRVLAGRGKDEPIWAFAGLPMSLPEGVYAIQADLDPAHASDCGRSDGRSARMHSRSTRRRNAPRRAGLAGARRSRRGRSHRAQCFPGAGSHQHTDRGHGARAVDRGRRGGGAGRGRKRARAARRRTARARIIRPFTRWVAPARVRLACSTSPGAMTVAPKVTLVGKGVCFDTGGLNIKPREGMLRDEEGHGRRGDRAGTGPGADGGRHADPPARTDSCGRELDRRQRLPAARHHPDARRQDGRDRQYRRRRAPDPVRRARGGGRRTSGALDRLRDA